MNYKLNEASMFADITDGTAIVINSLTGIYYGMNGFGTEVFDNFMSGSSSEEVLQAIMELPGVPDDISDRLNKFVETLIGYEIILPDGSQAPRTPVFNPKVVAADDFTPGCVEYNDVSELLFADPIHEVDEETGWTPR